MAAWKKIANEGYEEIASATTRSYNPHGLGKGARRVKRLYNRAARREDARFHFKSQESA